MQNLNKIFSLLLIILSTDAALAAAVNLPEDRSAERRCIQEFIVKCTSLCQQVTDRNCRQTCTKNAVNQCRQAGQ